MLADTTAWVLGPQPAQRLERTQTSHQWEGEQEPRKCQFHQVLSSVSSLHTSLSDGGSGGSQVCDAFPHQAEQNRNKPWSEKALFHRPFRYRAPFLSQAVKKEQPTLHNFLIRLGFLPGSFRLWRAGEGRASPAESGMIVTEIGSHPALEWAEHGILVSGLGWGNSPLLRRQRWVCQPGGTRHCLTNREAPETESCLGHFLANQAEDLSCWDMAAPHLWFLTGGFHSWTPEAGQRR